MSFDVIWAVFISDEAMQICRDPLWNTVTYTRFIEAFNELGLGLLLIINESERYAYYT